MRCRSINALAIVGKVAGGPSWDWSNINLIFIALSIMAVESVEQIANKSQSEMTLTSGGWGRAFANPIICMRKLMGFPTF
jgi:hypothetical protein